MKLSVAHKLAIEKLSRKAHSKDLVSEELFISVGDCRRVLGNELNIPRVYQTRFVRELVEAGCAEVVDKRNLKIINK